MKQQNRRYPQAFGVEGDLALKLSDQQLAPRQRSRAMQASQRPNIRRDIDLEYELEQMRRQRARRYALERQRRQESERQRQAAEQARQQQEQRRMQLQRAGRRRAATVLFVTVLLAGLSFMLLCRQAKLEKAIILQNNIRNEIKSETKQVEELQVQLNKKGNIGQIQEYARTSLSMDYPSSENVRTIALP